MIYKTFGLASLGKKIHSMNTLTRSITTAFKRPILTTSLLAAPLLSIHRGPLYSSICQTSSLKTSSRTMAPANATAFLDTLAARRSIYALTKNTPVPDSRVVEVVQQIMLNVPSAFNLQPIRAVILFNEEHDKFWQKAHDAVPKIMGTGEQAERTQGRTKGFLAGSGSVLFFTDTATNKQAQQNMPTLAHFFPEWAKESSGMHQFSVWTALEAEGFGASLQHYQFLGSDFVSDIQATHNIPSEWELQAQVVFGGRGDVQLLEKKMKDLSETVKVFGAK